MHCPAELFNPHHRNHRGSPDNQDRDDDDEDDRDMDEGFGNGHFNDHDNDHGSNHDNGHGNGQHTLTVADCKCKPGYGSSTGEKSQPDCSNASDTACVWSTVTALHVHGICHQ